MIIEHVQHVNIRCAERDLPRVERFYIDVLGLRSGYRPAFSFAGAWLYDSANNPLIHVSARFPADSFVKDGHNGSVDHVAFKASGVAGFRERLKALGIDFEEQNIERAGYQVFLYDPIGTKIELNFSDEAVPEAVPLGTVGTVSR